MTIQNQEIEEVKSSFGVNAEVADAIDKKAVAPGKVQKNGDEESESIPQGSSLPKTKISMINAVMSKLSKMKKEDVEQQLDSMDTEEEEQMNEAAHGYKLKLTKTTHPKDVTDDEDEPVKATEKHYEVHQNDKKVGNILHHYNDYGGHFYDADLHGKKVPYDRSKGGEGAHNFLKSVVNTKFHSNLKKEEYEQMDELDASTLKSYKAKAIDSGRSAMITGNKPTLAKRTAGVKNVNKKLGEAEYEQMDEARSQPVDISFETRRGKTENQQEVEHAARYEKSHGVKSKFADGPNGRTVVYSHSDPKKVKGALIKHHGGEDVSHIKIKESVGKISRDDIDVSEDIAAAFSGSDLSEEFKAQATEIFETAVVSSVNMKLAEMAEQAEQEYAEEMQSIEEGLTTKIDEYLDYVVEQWMEENKLAVESGLRSEVTENFLSGLRNLFAENWIDIPEEKVEVVEELAGEVEHLTATLDEEMQKNIELKKQVEKFEREIAFVDVSEGLTEMQIAKFESLAEAVDYEDSESYKERLETIRTSFFESRSQDVTEGRTTLDEEFIETSEISEKKLEPNMQVYSAAISRSVKK